jgi:hypothetical protein
MPPPLTSASKRRSPPTRLLQRMTSRCACGRRFIRRK